MKRHSLLESLAIAALGFGLSTLTICAQGILTPVGGPAPMMKTLSQLEPRTDVLTLSGDANNQYVINTPGSYYLTTNIVGAADKNAIGILTNNVSLDLKGFSILGTGGDLSGIMIGPATNVAICNGIINGCGGAGIYASSNLSVNCRYQNIIAANNADVGIEAGPQSHLVDCTAVSNSFWTFVSGFEVDWMSTLTRCKSLYNSGFGFATGGECIFVNRASYYTDYDGFTTTDHCSLQGCVSVGNTGDGVSASSDCMVKDSFLAVNTAHGVDFDADGLRPNTESTIKGCLLQQNAEGIFVGSQCLIEDNLCVGSPEAVEGSDLNRIDSNHTVSNSSEGILVYSTLNLIVRNSSDKIVIGDTNNNSYGPFVSLGSGQIFFDTGWENFVLTGGAGGQ